MRSPSSRHPLRFVGYWVNCMWPLRAGFRTPMSPTACDHQQMLLRGWSRYYQGRTPPSKMPPSLCLAFKVTEVHCKFSWILVLSAITGIIVDLACFGKMYDRNRIITVWYDWLSVLNLNALRVVEAWPFQSCEDDPKNMSWTWGFPRVECRYAPAVVEHETLVLGPLPFNSSVSLPVE